MHIAIIVTHRDITTFIQTLHEHLPNERISIYPNIEDPESVDIVIAWKYPNGYLQSFKNLKLICSFGAGVDHIFADPFLPSDPIITRIVDSGLTISMTRFILMCVLNTQYCIFQLRENQERKSWQPNLSTQHEPNIGIMGFGVLGQYAAMTLHQLGYTVNAWCRTEKHDIPFDVYAQNELSEFLKKTNILVCLLPLTDNTRGILNRELFDQLPAGSTLIQVGRGFHLKDEDLIEALQSNQLSSAWLDVFQVEPLPHNSRLWSTPGVFITPHIASITNQRSAAIQISKNILRLKKGEPILYKVDKTAGY